MLKLCNHNLSLNDRECLCEADVLWDHISIIAMLDQISNGTLTSQLNWILQCHHPFMYIWDPPSWLQHKVFFPSVYKVYFFSRYNVTANNGLLIQWSCSLRGGPTDR